MHGGAVAIMRNLLTGLLIVYIVATMQAVFAAPNPVLPGVADAGVIRFNGRYHLMGVHTDGAFYVSRDLVEWTGPHHAFSMNNTWATGPAGEDSQIHACDIVLHKGLFHLYWSVNYHDLRAIGHATASHILGPYQEPIADRPFDGRIDPQLFVDDDGACYFYTTKFTFGNAIYGQAMHGPDAPAGAPKPLLSAMPGTWELLDHKVNEASFTRRYRDRYYMLYNANHTGLEYGNYAIGCATGDTPLGFSNETKYSHYLLRDNWDRIHENARVISPLACHGEARWKLTDTPPEGDWTARGFDDSTWAETKAAFGDTERLKPGGMMFTEKHLHTHWPAGDIWLRRGFYFDNAWRDGDLFLFVHHNADAEVFINGVRACDVSGSSGGYVLTPLANEAPQALRQGDNVLAIRCAPPNDRPRYIDAGLYLFEPGTAEPVVMNCGQPNLVRGPNGFEWWLVYFAVYNGHPRRGQAIERVHFFDRELFIEGPTSAATPGAFLPPAPPTFADHFDGEALDDVWRPGSGEWRVADGALLQEDREGLHRVNMALPVYNQYLFETGLRYLDSQGSQIGVIAWERGPEQTLYIGLDRRENAWFWAHRQEFLVRFEVFPMPESFDWDGPIMLRVLKNETDFILYLNDIPAPGDAHIHIRNAGPGRPGLVTRDSAAAFDNVVFTAGWDEYDAHIRGWGAAVDGTPATGTWGVGNLGMLVEPGAEEARLFKGDLLKDFEWNVQVTPEAPLPDAEFGCYAWYLNGANYIRLSLDAQMNTAKVSGKIKGETIAARVETIPLREKRLLPPDSGGINLRFRRIGEELVIFVDGREMFSLVGDWSPAQVGLFARNVSCRFNGITLFARGPISSK